MLKTKMSKMTKTISMDKKMKKNLKVFSKIYLVFLEQLLQKFLHTYHMSVCKKKKAAPTLLILSFVRRRLWAMALVGSRRCCRQHCTTARGCRAKGSTSR